MPPPPPVGGINPYAPPLSELAPPPVPSGQLYRSGKLLVAALGAQLPPICVKTGAPATRFLVRKYSWHPPWAYLGLFGGAVPYVILALILTKRGRLTVGLSDATAAKRNNWILAGWIGVVVLLAGMFVAATNLPEDVIGAASVVGFLLVLIWIVIATARATLLVPTRITATHLFLKGASPALLESLPPWPGSP